MSDSDDLDYEEDDVSDAQQAKRARYDGGDGSSGADGFSIGDDDDEEEEEEREGEDAEEDAARQDARQDAAGAGHAGAGPEGGDEEDDDNGRDDLREEGHAIIREIEMHRSSHVFANYDRQSGGARALVAATKEYMEKWERMPVDPTECMEWICDAERMNIDVENDTPIDIQRKGANAKYIVATLARLLLSNSLCTTDPLNDNDELILESDIIQVQNAIHTAMEVASKFVELRIRQDRDRFQRIPADAMIDANTCLLLTDDERTKYCQLHDFFLHALESMGFRKVEDKLFESITVEWQGVLYDSMAWKQSHHTPDIKTFVRKNCGRHIDAKQYENIMHSTKYRKEIIEQLTEEEEPELPTLNRSRYFISFRNCIVHTLGAIFPYDDRENWDDIAQRANDAWVAAAAKAKQLLSEKGIYVPGIDLTTRVDVETQLNMRICAPDPLQATMKFIDEEFDPNWWPALDESWDDVDVEKPTESSLFHFFTSIPTPHLDTIFDVQLFDDHTKFIAMATQAELLFPLKLLHDQERFTMYMGRGGCGKSIMINLISDILPENKMGFLSSNGETTFWGHSLHNCWALAWLEAKRRTAVNQGDFQSMISGETVNIPVKGKAPIIKKWNAPIVVAGNEMPDFEDTSESIYRRMMIFLFEKRPAVRQPLLARQIRQSLAPILAKMLRSFHLFVLLYGQLDWEALINGTPIIGKQLSDMRAKAKQQVDPLTSFINDGDKYTVDPNGIVLEKRFVDDYQDYRRNTRGEKPVKWGESAYMTTFENFNLSVTRMQTFTDSMGTSHSNVRVIKGLVLTEQADD